MGISGSNNIDARDVSALSLIPERNVGLNFRMYQVPQLCAVWCAEGAWPFSALGEQAHQGILHPTVVWHLPSKKAVLNNIARLYTAVQDSVIQSLKVLFPSFSIIEQ
jgi:hypothetical protein